MNLQNTPKEITTIQEGKMNMRRIVMIEHCFRNEETYETIRRKKTLWWLPSTYKLETTWKGKIYLKQLLLKVMFPAKRYGKGLLDHIKEMKCIKY